MDTRKLKNNGESLIDIGNGDGMMGVEEIVTEDGLTAGQDYDTLFYAFDEGEAAELVRRWNNFPALVEALKDVSDLLSMPLPFNNRALVIARAALKAASE